MIDDLLCFLTWSSNFASLCQRNKLCSNISQIVTINLSFNVTVLPGFSHIKVFYVLNLFTALVFSSLHSQPCFLLYLL